MTESTSYLAPNNSLSFNTSKNHFLTTSTTSSLHIPSLHFKMRYTSVVVAAAIGLVSAQRDCQGLYKACIAAGTPEVVCQCSSYSCSGEDSARLRDYCATATAGLAPVTGTIPQPSGAPQVNAPAGSVALGGNCGADEQCSGGAQCFGTTAGTIRTCGSFNAKCSSDSQCGMFTPS